MKKFLSLILILSLIAPACALAETDPIVGVWYISMEYADYPDPSLFPDGIRSMAFLVANADGTVESLEINITTAGMETSDYQVTGKWEKGSFGSYTISIIGVGEYPATIKNGCLHTVLYDGVYYVMHRMEPINWYTDIYRK